MENEYMKRGYLLPEGCKDIIDVLKPKIQHVSWLPSPPKPSPPAPLPPIVGELAAVLTGKPFRIIADLMGFGVFATVNQQLDFDMIANVLRKYGFTARKSD